MTKAQIKDFLNEKPGYLKVGPDRLSERLNCSIDTCKAALEEVRLETKGSDFDVDNSSENVISEFQSFLDTNDILSSDVASVKFWQTMSGQQRFSVVTKNEGRNVSEIKKEIEDFAAIYSPTVPKVSRPNDLSDPVVYEISLPDIHYGKLHGCTLKEIEEQFISVVQNLVQKAKGLNIEKFLLPIGNDGMNSEGMRRTTTKGTPQADSDGWKETFRGYWKLMVTAIDYLKQIAPVDVIVVSGNHDYERMFYAGDVIAGWYRDDKNITVDNLEDSRKYYEYGVNMIMFTHGDNEKAADMPLIMATEQPEMFARSTHRETHCGHFHKEMVNEYRGVKVRFIPSICPNDEWHKRMGYEAKRTGQAYIWNKKTGLEGYLQSNLGR
jgi:hypothetical protein